MAASLPKRSHPPLDATAAASQPQQAPGVLLRACTMCKKEFAKAAFSGSQWKKDTRKCKVCVVKFEEAQEKAAPAPLRNAGGKVMSKSQRKKANKLAREKERRAQLKKEAANLPNPRKLENEAFAKRLPHMTVHEIKADGHCLYRAVDDQLMLRGAGSYTHKRAEDPVLSLRELARDYLLMHTGDFIPFCLTRRGEMMDLDQYQAYCRRICEYEPDVMWGGHVEIMALASALKRQIVVHTADGEPQPMGPESVLPALEVSFHKHFLGLGEHYNSLRTRE